MTAPEVVDRLSSTHVLTRSGWGGLAASGADDVPRLCGVALNAYLTMLLDTGTLHCDPHPGNLLRTTDGKLHLDWGMTLDVPTDLQLALLEFIANLQAEKYDAPTTSSTSASSPPTASATPLVGDDYGIARMLKLAAGGGGLRGRWSASSPRTRSTARS